MHGILCNSKFVFDWFSAPRCKLTHHETPIGLWEKSAIGVPAMPLRANQGAGRI